MGQIFLYIEAIQITISSGVYKTNIYHSNFYLMIAINFI